MSVTKAACFIVTLLIASSATVVLSAGEKFGCTCVS